MDKITILILAGGDSSRMWPLNDKTFMHFLGKPLAFYTLAQLAKFGFKDIVIVVGKSNRSDFSRIKNEFTGFKINIVNQKRAKGQAGAILSADKYIAGKPIIIINQSDLVEDILYQQLIEYQKSDPDGILVSKKTKDFFPGGYLTVHDGIVRSITEKPAHNKRPSNLVRLVFDYYKNGSDILQAIEKVRGETDDRYEKAITASIARGKIFRSLPYTGYWSYLKYPWHVLNISSHFLSKIKNRQIKNVQISKNATITGNVIIEDNVRIMDNSSIIGPSYIGFGTIIGQNCLIRESMIGQNNVIGFSTEMARSYVENNCWFHSNYIGDSVVSSYTGIGAGAVVANFRLDENVVKSQVAGNTVDSGKIKLGTVIGKNVRIGVNASIMPGVKIGKNSYVGSGVVLTDDLGDNRFCYWENPKYKVMTNKHLLPVDSRNKSKVSISKK